MSSTPLAVVNKQEWTPEQMQLITNTVARNASPAELQLFLYRCRNMGLDPLKPGQVHFIKYGANPGSIVVGIEGVRLISERTGKKAGVNRGVIKDASGNLIGAWCEVHRKDWPKPAREEVPFAEYNTGSGNWKKMPETMIKKVAEAAALRMAFPDVLGGVYIEEEMDQEASAVTGGDKITPHGPTGEIEQCGVIDTETYYIPFGKWRGRTLEQVARDHGFGEMNNYVGFLEDKAAKENKPMRLEVTDFIERVGRYIVECERHEAEPQTPGTPTIIPRTTR